MDSNDNKKKVVVALVVIVAVAALGLLAARVGEEDNTRSSSNSTTSQSTNKTAEPDANINSGNYKDGTYKSSGTYQSPGGREMLFVTVTIEDGKVVDSEVEQKANNRDSEQYQKEFKENYKPLVVGKMLNEIMLSTVSGSSLTSKGFNDALDEIKSQSVTQS